MDGKVWNDWMQYIWIKRERVAELNHQVGDVTVKQWQTTTHLSSQLRTTTLSLLAEAQARLFQRRHSRGITLLLVWCLDGT